MKSKEVKGSLLLEIIICTVLIGLVGVGVLGMLAINRQFTVRSRHKIEALNLARQKMEEFESMAYDSIVTGGDDSDSVTFSDGSTATREWTLADVDWDGDLISDGKEVTVTISW